MTAGPIRLLAIAGLLGATAIGGLGGCAQPGPIASQRATVGSLKASVSQLEYANEKLKQQVADLKSESTRVANELDQEHTDNEELHARLEDAKYAIRKQGGDVTAFDRAARASTAAAADDDIPPPAKSSPISRPKPRRKSPITKIDRAKKLLDPEPGALELPADSPDPGPQAARDDDGRWLPVARGPRRGGGVEVR